MKITGYGVKKTLGKATALWTTTGEWLSHRFVGLGSNHSAKQWKTRAGAQRAADQRGGEVFTITATALNY